MESWREGGGGGAHNSQKQDSRSEQGKGADIGGEGIGCVWGEAAVVAGFVGIPSERGQGFVSGFWGWALEGGGDGAEPSEVEEFGVAEFEFFPVVDDGAGGCIGRVDGVVAPFDTEAGQAGLCGAEGIEAEEGGFGLGWAGEERGVDGLV